MGNEANELLKKALTLPVAERAELAGSLLESLEEAEDESVKPRGTRKSTGAWRISIPGKLNQSASKKRDAGSHLLLNDRAATLLASGCSRRGRGSGALVSRSAVHWRQQDLYTKSIKRLTKS